MRCTGMAALGLAAMLLTGCGKGGETKTAKSKEAPQQSKKSQASSTAKGSRKQFEGSLDLSHAHDHVNSKTGKGSAKTFGALESVATQGFVDDLTKSQDQSKRLAAIKELAQFKNPIAVRHIEEATKDKNPEVAKAAKAALASMKK